MFLVFQNQTLVIWQAKSQATSLTASSFELGSISSHCNILKRFNHFLNLWSELGSRYFYFDLKIKSILTSFFSELEVYWWKNPINLKEKKRRLVHIRKSKKVYQKLPDKESVHLLQAQLQNLLFEIPINLCSNLQVLLKHLAKSGVNTHYDQEESEWARVLWSPKNDFNYKPQEENKQWLQKVFTTLHFFQYMHHKSMVFKVRSSRESLAKRGTFFLFLL